MGLTDEERERYARHISLPELGEEGQLRLRRGSVLVIGAGGLGSPVALYLAAAGIGRVGIVDGDCVERTNLQRQVIHSTADVGMMKVESARNSMLAINPSMKVDAIDEFVTEENIGRMIAGYDFVIDATDSLAIKYLVDKACTSAAKPYNHGAIWRYEGQTMTVLPGTTTYRDLFPDADGVSLERKPVGPLGVVPGILGSIQAAEAVKYIAGIGELLTDRLLRFDVLTMRFNVVRLK